MIRTIFKNWHRAFPPVFGLYWNKKVITRTVTFNRSFAYDIGPDQLDICKLFGIGYLPSVKKYSARFGCRYNINTDRMDMLAYVHDNDFVTTNENEVFICSCEFGKAYEMRLRITYYNYSFVVGDVIKHVVRHSFNGKKLGYKLGLFFGGNKAAPHKITVNIK